MTTHTIGFIGQGFIGKNYADDFEERGFTVVRYAKEEPYIQNREAIKQCSIVFIAVPTPTTPAGYDDHILRDVISLTAPGTIVVLKSTILPGLTRTIQKSFLDRVIMHSPEFLSEVTAKYDASHPFMNIVGITEMTPELQTKAGEVMAVLPQSPYNKIVTTEEAELIKYAHNCNGYIQIIFFNLLYDLAQKVGADFNMIRDAAGNDPFMTNKYASPVHKTGRGAGGHCFIKDMAAFREVYSNLVGDETGVRLLQSLEQKNKELLKQTSKDLDLLHGVYGDF
jgi:UDPglucose 6-dehydrogenase